MHVVACASLVSALALAALAAGAGESDFYAGKNIQLLIGFSSGGGYDAYARLLARHLGRHIPGTPRIVAQNMPGAGSLRAVNYLYGVAPKDGTVIGAFSPGIVVEPLLGRSEAAFDASKFTWLGSISREVSVCAFTQKSGIKSWQDMQNKKHVVGASGAGAESDVFANVLRKLFGLPMKVVSGYPGGSEIILAMERGEVDGRCGWSWVSLLSRSKALLDNGVISVTLQIGLAKDKALPHVPLIMELTQDARSKAALTVIVARQSMARPFAAPPGIPLERARILQSAFAATARDAEFLADASNLNLEVEPVAGAEIEMLLKEVYGAPADVLKLAGELVRD
jgi:tripartite-type tricarboxylate transporter receptor subunit TctC